MFRYDDPTNVNPQPAPTAPGTPGYYTDNPGSPSIVRAENLNMLQEEICNVITGAGLVLSKGAQNQLFLAIAAMSGGAAQWTTGDIKYTWKPVADAGWILANDGTIGNALSGATTRANADCQSLFEFLWNNFTNVQAPVTPLGRGASAAIDWLAAKKIQLLKSAGRSPLVAGAGAGLTARTLGDSGGEEAHLLVSDELPGHFHTTTFPNAEADSNSFDSDGGLIGHGGAGPAGTTAINTNNAGSDDAHNTMHPYGVQNMMVKL